MKCFSIYVFLILLVVLFQISCSERWTRKAIGRTYRGAYKKVSASAAALILRRLGDKRSFQSLRNRILRNCVHMRFLGWKLRKKFRLSRKLRKSKSLKQSFAQRFVKYVLRSLFACSVVRKSDIAHKLREAKRNVSKAKSSSIVRRTLALAQSFRGTALKVRKGRPGYARFTKGKFTRYPKKPKRRSNKKVKKALKHLKSLKSLGRKIRKYQRKCRKNNFRKTCTCCRKAKKLSKIYRKRASKVKKVLSNSCRRFKRMCFKFKVGCKKMFKMCRKSSKIVKGLKGQKAVNFARVFTRIILSLNK